MQARCHCSGVKCLWQRLWAEGGSSAVEFVRGGGGGGGDIDLLVA